VSLVIHSDLSFEFWGTNGYKYVLGVKIRELFLPFITELQIKSFRTEDKLMKYVAFLNHQCKIC